MKIKELYSSKDKWTKGAFARDKNSNPLESEQVHLERACSFCLSGAIFKCYPNLVERNNVIWKVYDKTKTNSIVAFNDSSNFETVKKLVNDLDI